MSSLMIRIVLGALCVSAMLVSPGLLTHRARLVTKVHAQEGCSVATLRGAYGFYRTGTAGISSTSSGVPLVAVGIATFDGTGAVATGQQTIRRNGITTSDLFGENPPSLPSVGPYEVNPDCTAKFLLPDGTVFAHVVVVDGGKELFGLSLSAGNSVYGVWKKIDNQD